MPQVFWSVSSFVERADKSVPVFFSAGNAGVGDLAESLAQSMRRVGLPFTFFASDFEAVHRMERVCDVVFDERALSQLSILRGRTAEPAAIGDEGFAPLAWIRYPLIGELLANGLHASYLDSDIFVLRDFLGDIKSYLDRNNGVDGVVQMNDKGDACTGFMSFHPRAKGRFARVYNERALMRGGYSSFGGLADQAYFNDVLMKSRSRRRLRIQLLSRDLYPTGKWWVANHNELGATAKIVHHNGVIGNQAKIEQMKRFGHWHAPDKTHE